MLFIILLILLALVFYKLWKCEQVKSKQPTYCKDVPIVKYDIDNKDFL